jgi:malate dehydrogenase (oxaloacetate-decarboxylating)(NADP+)
LSKQVTQKDLDAGRLYPPQKQVRDVSVKIACDISEWYYKNGKATTYPEPKDLEKFVREQLYDTEYTTYVPNTWNWPEAHQKPR